MSAERIDIMEKNNISIIINNAASCNAIGEQRNKNAVPVYCITDNKIYASVADAAIALGVTQGAVSQQLTGRTQTVKRKRFCRLNEVNEHLDEITQVCEMRRNYIFELEAKAAQWDAYQAQLAAEAEAKAKAKEAHERAVANKQAEIESIRYVRKEQQAQVDRLRLELGEAERALGFSDINLMFAEGELEELLGNTPN
jgi:predicted transcriptional regulator